MSALRASQETLYKLRNSCLTAACAKDTFAKPSAARRTTDSRYKRRKPRKRRTMGRTRARRPSRRIRWRRRDFQTTACKWRPSTRKLPARNVRQRTYALDQKELPLEMQKFLQEVKRFFTHEVNLQRQAKPLVNFTFWKAQERILCELFRKFGENSFHDFIIVVSINVLTSSFSCL